MINLLQSFHAEVQYQAIELIQILMSNKWNDDNITSALTEQLISCLNDPPNQERMETDDNENLDLIDSLKGGPMPDFYSTSSCM